MNRRSYIFSFFLLYSLMVTGQKENALIREYLVNSKEASEIEFLLGIIKKDENKEYIKKNIPCISPIKPSKIKRYSSLFGYRLDPVTNKKKLHKGLDIAADLGTPVHAAANGEIEYIKISNNGYGFQIKLIHDFGYKTKYAHLYYINVEGEKNVKKGDIIGFVGSTGKSTGNHLHFEIFKNTKQIDPQPYLELEYY